jgi:hypothetical protein
VFALTPGTTDFYGKPATGFAMTGNPGQINYDIKVSRSGAFGRGKVVDVRLELVADTTQEIPELLLVGKQGRAPIGRTDGAPILNVPRIRLDAGVAKTFSIETRHWSSSLFVKLAAADAQQDQRVRLIPARGQLCLG